MSDVEGTSNTTGSRKSKDSNVTSAPQADESALIALTLQKILSGVIASPAKKAQDVPPRPQNAFFLYRQAHTKEASSDLPSSMSRQRDFSKHLGQRWNALGPEGQAPWVELAAIAKQKHYEQYPNYRYKPRKRRQKAEVELMDMKEMGNGWASVGHQVGGPSGANGRTVVGHSDQIAGPSSSKPSSPAYNPMDTAPSLAHPRPVRTWDPDAMASLFRIGRDTPIESFEHGGGSDHPQAFDTFSGSHSLPASGRFSANPYRSLQAQQRDSVPSEYPRPTETPLSCIDPRLMSMNMSDGTQFQSSPNLRGNTHVTPSQLLTMQDVGLAASSGFTSSANVPNRPGATLFSASTNTYALDSYENMRLNDGYDEWLGYPNSVLDPGVLDLSLYGTNSDDQRIPNLALNQEWVELDLFHYGLSRFSVQGFEAVGLTAEDRHLIQFMADQEVGHAALISNILQGRGEKPCKYQYNFTTVRGFINFCQKVTRVGESGVYGFLEHLDSRAAANLLLETVSVEARQQVVFRQFEGLFPMPMWFLPGMTQAMAWTLLSLYIIECPAENPRIEWQGFPALNITNNPDARRFVNGSGIGEDTTPAITTHNRTNPLSEPGRTVNFTWESPGKTVGYNNSYVTNTTAGAPQFVTWISQLNTTYTPLEDIRNNSGSTTQPGESIFEPGTAPTVNGTVFIAITDSDICVTPFNISLINPHIVAGPALYQSG